MRLTEGVAMKTSFSILSAAGLLLAAGQISAQTTGTSHPESLDDTITASAPVAVAKPSPAVAAPVVVAPAPALHVREDDGATAATAAEIVTQSPVRTAQTTDDGDKGIAAEDVLPPNELPPGTLLKVRLNHVVSTQETERNAAFDALLTVPVKREGKVFFPAGTVLSGHVTELEAGHHLGRGAAIHLQPELVTLPDGTSYKLRAQVVDLVQDRHAHITQEGTIVRNDRTPGTEAAIGASTGAGAITGAVLGGGVGAVVGAGIGAGVSTTVWAKQSTSQTLAPGTEIVFMLNEPVMLRVAQ